MLKENGMERLSLPQCKSLLIACIVGSFFFPHNEHSPRTAETLFVH